MLNLTVYQNRKKSKNGHYHHIIQKKNIYLECFMYRRNGVQYGTKYIIVFVIDMRYRCAHISNNNRKAQIQILYRLCVA